MNEDFFLSERWANVLQKGRNVFYQSQGIKELFYKENEILLKNINEESVVLDVGCGLGTHLNLISKYCKEIIGIDYSEVVLKRCRKETGHLPNVKTFNMNAKRLEFPDNAFDQVNCMFNTLGNMKDPMPVMKEITRVTKPSCHIIFSLYNLESIPERLDYYHKTGLPDATASNGEVSAFGGKFYSRSYSEEEITKMCLQTGLDVEVYKTRIAYVCEAVKK
ncbi:MAG: class I SAM-dependent methyltransferase [Candidatus Micrarchaeota archaeon]|nr:class I SAM-dependent methyltransferase [Candidatus Micrarchaeota archaeon]